MAENESRSNLRIWPGVVIVLLQVIVTFGSGILAPATPIQFFGMTFGPLVGALALLIWWLIANRITKRGDGWLGALLFLAFLVGTFVAADPTMYMVVFVYGLPLLCAAFVAWAWFTRSWEARPRRLALVAALFLACIAWPLMRSDGVEGDLAPELAWRWGTTAEEELLAQSELLPPPPPATEVIDSGDEAQAETVDTETTEDAAAETEGYEAAVPADDDGTTVADAATTDDQAAEGTETEDPGSEEADTGEDAVADDGEPALASSEGAPAQEDAPVWPGFRGPHRDSVVPGVKIATDWQASPPEELWRHPIGPGWGSFAVDGDRLYTQEQRGEEEIVSAYDATTGEPVWMHRDDVRFWEAMAGPGPRATPTLHEGKVYAFGATGLLNALDAETGALIWQRDAAEDTSAKVPEWGFSSSPLVVDGLVIVHTGAPDGKAAIAYAEDTGEPVWTAPGGALSYSSGHLAEIDGVRQVIFISGDGAVGLVPESGEVLWQHEWSVGGGARVVQPGFTSDGDVLIGTGFGQGMRRLNIVPASTGSWQVEEGWTSRAIKPYYNDFVVHEGHVYGFDGRILTSVALETGERAWKGGRYGNGQLLLLPDQDLLLVLSDKGEIALVKATPEAFQEVAKMEAIEGKTWNHPVLADGVLYVRNGEEMAAFKLAGE